MLLETIACLFLFPRQDVFQGQRLTSEANEHTYGLWRMILREFNMEQLIRIVQKAIIKNDAMFESNFDALRSNTMKGYPSGLQEFIKNMQKGSAYSGPIDVDLTKPAVDQLWDTVQGILSFGTNLMRPFLKIFGSEVGNGLSPFAVEIETPRCVRNIYLWLFCEILIHLFCFFFVHSDLSNLVQQFFCPPLPDHRAVAASAASTGSNNNHDLMHESESDNEDPSVSFNMETPDTSQSQLEIHIAGLKTAAELDSDADVDIDISSNSDGVGDYNTNNIINGETEVDTTNTSDAFMQFKTLLQNSNNLVDVLSESAKLMVMLTLGCDKGSITMDHKFKSRTERWFTSKSLGDSKYKTDVLQPNQPCLLLRRDSIIELHVRKGGQEQVLEYRALAFFTKYYNKWFVSIQSEFPWVNDKAFTKPKGRVLARLVKKSGAVYREVKLETRGEWAPQHVFRSVPFDEIIRVGSDLVEM